MFHKLFVTAGCAILAAALLFSGCHRKPRYEMAKERIEHFTDHLAAKLNLTPDQKTKLAEITKRFTDKFPDMQNNREKTMDALIKNFESEKFDTSALNTELDAVEKKMTEMKSMFVQAINDFHAILTPEQRQKFVEMLKKHLEKHEEKTQKSM